MNETPNDGEKLEDLEKGLYSRSGIPEERRQGTLSEKSYDVANEWKKETPTEVLPPKMTGSNAKKFFMFSLIFLGISLLFAGYMLLVRKSTTVSNNNIQIAILGNAFTPGGEELPLQIEIENENSVPLEFADLIVEYSKGSDTGFGVNDTSRVRTSVGTIAPGQTITETVTVTLFGAEGDTRNIKVLLEYRVPNSNSIFVKEKAFAVNVSSAPLALTIEAPADTSSNQEITLNIKVLQLSQELPTGMVLKMEYPIGFVYKESLPGPIFGNSIFSLDDIAQGEEKVVTIKGTLQAQDGEERSFRAYVGEQDRIEASQIRTLYTSALHPIAIRRPFLEARLSLNGDSRDVIVSESEKDVRGEIAWRNNLSDKIVDATIIATLDGEVLDESRIKATGGFYDSSKNQIIWDRTQVPALADIDPGESGTLSFSFASLPLARGGTIATTPEMSVSVSIKGKQPNQANALKEVNSFETKTVRLYSELRLIAEGIFFGGPFPNVGPYPPVAEQETTYTVHWKLTNTANTLSSAQVKATLPIYARFTGSTSPANETVTYNPATREVVWKLDRINRGTGTLEAAREVYFQVSLTPSISQQGSIVDIISSARVTATDTFTKTTVSASAGKVTTGLSGAADGRVQ